jgi:hypothetical protein
MAPDAPPRGSVGKGRPHGGFDLVEHLRAFLDRPPPETLLITGAVGTGKSTLLQALVEGRKGPLAFIGYRSTPAVGGPEGAASSPTTVSLLFVDPEGTRDEPSPSTAWNAEHSMSFAPAAMEPEDALPRPIADAVARLSAQGGGLLVVDAWDASTERQFREWGGAGASVRILPASIAFLRGRFGMLPVRGAIALSTEPDPQLLSAADGVIRLGWEDIEGGKVRVLSIPKLRQLPVPETRYLYTLHGGQFQCPPQLPTGFRPPLGPPDPDPEPDEDSLFPGSQSFASAFGRLRYRSLTGLQVPPRFASSLADVFLFPLVAHTLTVGGRVVWVPSPASGVSQIVGQLSRWVPADFVRERLRVVSAGGMDPSLGDLRSVVLPLRRESGGASEPRPASAPSVGPLFPDSFQFLRGTPEGRPALYVIYLDGLHALAAVAGIPVNAATFPMVVGSYMRLPRFHGFGFGRSDDPLDNSLVASVETHIHVEERYGRTVLLGRRPRTTPYILEWPDESGRYSLLPVT